MKSILLKIFFCSFLFLQLSNLHAQNFTHQASVIEFLDRMAQKGNIVFNNLMKPVDRTQVYHLLEQLQTNPNLLAIEKQEVSFYIALYKFDHINLNPVSAKEIEPNFSYLNKNIQYQPHAFVYTDKDFRVMADPVLEFTKQTYSKHSSISSTGFQIMGYAGKRIGFQFSVRDINEKGDYDSTRIENNFPGFNRKPTTSNNLLNYSQMNATISYRLNKAMITAGQDKNIIGFGQMGNIVLSDKAPSYPFVRLQYQPTSWIKFNYMHAWLQSGVLDSTKSYGLGNTVYGGKRLIYVPKFMATHFIELMPMKGLSFNIGESIVYTDNIELPFIIPISFFKAYDNSRFGDNISSGANGQIFMGFSSRNQLPKTHLYGQLFIDEIRVESIFNQSKSRNQWAYQLGASVTDFYLPTMTLTAEITRINPFVYRNFIPAQNYTSAGFLLGDWMGSNANRIYLSAQYKPKAKLSVKTYYMLMHKGGPGTIQDQYFGTPQLKFGYDPIYKRTEIGLEAYYEMYNNVQFKFSHINNAYLYYLQKGTSYTVTSLGFIWSNF
jgi:hypothetical protein